MADSTVVTGDRGVFGLTPATAAPASPLRVQGAPARAAAAPVVSLDGNGDLRVGALVAADIPAAFTRRDVAETIAQPWTWAPGQTIEFAAGTLQPPQATTRSTGTRLILEPVPGSTEYAIGRETAALWTSVPSGGEHRWYQSNVCRMRMASDGSLYVENGGGYLVLDATGSHNGTVFAPAALGLIGGNTAGGYISLSTGGGLIQPVTNYRENLGNIARKFLSLHAAELWVETLVAQQTLATIGGRILTGPTTTLTRDCAPGDTTIYVKHNAFKLHTAGVEYGSKLLLERAGQIEVMAVTNVSTPAATAQGDYPYTVLRAFGGSAYQWFAGDALFDTGKLAAPTGAFIDQYSLQGYNRGSTAGPTIVGNVRTGANAFDWIEHWAIGNLYGLYNNGAANVMGAAFGRPDLGVHVQIDATNGIRMLSAGNGQAYGEWRTDGTVRFGYAAASNMSFTPADGNLSVTYNGVNMLQLVGGTLYLHTGLILGAGASTVPFVRSYGASAWNAGSGFYLDAVQSTGTARALIGNSAGRRLQWDGASLKVVSDGLTIDENGIVLTAAASTAPARQIRFEPGGALLWDAGTAGYFTIAKSGGSGINIAAGGTGDLVLAGPNSQIYVRQSGVIEFNMGAGTAARPLTDAVLDFGTTSLRWRYIMAHYYMASGVKCGFWSDLSMPYQLQLSADLAAKPTSSTWTVVSGRSAKRDERDVDAQDALATIRRVGVKRFTFTGAHDTIDGDEGIGPVADDVRDVLPGSVREVAGALTFNAHELFMLNVAAVQALAARLDDLERKG